MVIGTSVLLTTMACVAQQPSEKPAAQAAPAPAPAAAPAYALAGSVSEIMSGIVDPTSKVVFGAVAISTSKSGTKQTAPKTAADWAVVRRNALMLAEAGDLLKLPGRRLMPVAPIPGEPVKPVVAENLTPAQIEEAMKKDRASFDALAQGLTDAAMVALRAVDARNVEALGDAGETLDGACETCHLKFWYPPSK
jgi:hypothetical protein